MTSNELGIGGDLDLYDAEVQQITEINLRLQSKYARRSATFENLNALADEAMGLMEKAGFIATVSVFDDNMQPKLPPTITIHGRVDPIEFDPDRQQWEVKKEVADEQNVRNLLAKGGTKNQKVHVDATLEPKEIADD